MDVLTRDRARAAAIAAEELRAWTVTARDVLAAVQRAQEKVLYGGQAHQWQGSPAELCGAYCMRRIVEMGVPADGIAGTRAMDLLITALQTA